MKEKGKERIFVLIHSAAPSPVVVPAKEPPHVPNNKRKSGFLSRMSSQCARFYDLGSLTSKQKRIQPTQVVLGAVAIAWPGAGRCRRNFAGLKDP